jgi:NitT/TauT family transport system ATP-binding protein
LPLRLGHVDEAERGVTVNRLLAMVGLIDFAESRPHELSGGMRQRVALARSLGQESALLLMDEPFGALDAITRDALHDDLSRIWEQTGRSIIFVTHNVREAVRLGDRVVLMSSRPGRIARTWDVDIPRPRSLDSMRVASLATEITARLRTEIDGDAG